MTKRAEIDSETLMAYADGELSPIDAKRVERAIADDPKLKAQVDDHRRLRAMLANGFAAVAQAPVPDRLTRLLTPSPVADLAAARARRARGFGWRNWGTGIAIAASLVGGVLVGQRLDGNNAPVRARGDALVASAGLAQALDTQLASAQPAGGAVRMLVTFRDQSGTICRSFTGAALSGIACRDGGDWRLRETRAGSAEASTAYRQAGSGDARLMADAQAMMAGDPFDAAGEAQARARGWR
jgi:hypothetical protein